jgi:hypothetical protein
MPFAAMLLGLDKASSSWPPSAGCWRLLRGDEIPADRWKQYLVIVFFMALGMPLGMWAFARLDRVLLTDSGGIHHRECGPSAVEAFIQAEVGRAYRLRCTGSCFSSEASCTGLSPRRPAGRAVRIQGVADKGNFRATLVLLWSTLNAALIVQFALAGAFTGQAWGEFGLKAPFLIAGMVGGEIIHTGGFGPFLKNRVRHAVRHGVREASPERGLIIGTSKNFSFLKSIKFNRKSCKDLQRGP